LTTEEENIVRAAWDVPEDSQRIAVSLRAGAGGSSVDILDKHIFRHRRGWFFDESVNAYMWLLQERDARLCAADHSRNPIHIYSSYFFEKVITTYARDSRNLP
jgi:Ulp1 family protease